MRIGMRIRQARRNTKLSQSELAELLSVQRSAVSNWESTAGTLPSTSNLIAIARNCSVSVEWLVTGLGTMRMAGSDDVPAADAELVEQPHERELLERFREFSPKGQQAILDLMRELKTARRRRAAALGR